MKVDFTQLNENTINGLHKLGELNLDLNQLFEISLLTRKIIDYGKTIDKTIHNKYKALKNENDDINDINEIIDTELNQLYKTMILDISDLILFTLEDLKKFDKKNVLNSKDLDGIKFLIKYDEN